MHNLYEMYYNYKFVTVFIALQRAKKKDDGRPSTSTLSGAQRLERKIAMEEEQQNNQKQPENQSKKFTTYTTETHTKTYNGGLIITRADRDRVTSPDLCPANDAMQHMQNVFLDTHKQSTQQL